VRKWLVAGGIPVLLSLGLLWLRSGPRAPVPAVDPIVRWNADHADLADNAADLYRAAFAQLDGEADPNWPRTPIPPEAAAWVEQNQDALELARQAAERPHCWFTLQRNADGNLLPPHLEQLRAVAKLLHWRALIAAQQHDALTLADSAVTVDRIAKHGDEGAPTLICALVGIAIHALAHDGVTQPMLWPEMSAADRTAYVASLAPIFDPPPPLTDVLAGEEEDSVWRYLTGTPTSLQRTFFAAPDRFAGELERYFCPLRELAALPVERQCDPADPLVVRMQVLENEPVPKSNVPRLVASILVPSVLRSLGIRTRLIAEQRGIRTVLELFVYRDRAGAFPDTLEALAGDFKIDPFSGQPLVYRCTGDGFTLYSVGVDRKDNGGRHDSHFGEGKANSDYVFWPIPEHEATPVPATQP
jgi:hypothetical protein